VFQNGPLTGRPGPDWATWKSKNHYLPPTFYQVKGPGSLSQLHTWLRSDPITTDDRSLVSYKQLEHVVLAIGLAMRDIWITQFAETSPNLPTHVTNSPFEFHEYEQLSHHAEDLINGFQDT
jgi:hypothetical protein